MEYSSKKRYICDACSQTDRADNIAILNFLYNALQSQNLFSENKDGVKINLDKLDNSVVDGLYGYIKYKSDK
jgi:hypothetical protein